MAEPTTRKRLVQWTCTETSLGQSLNLAEHRLDAGEGVIPEEEKYILQVACPWDEGKQIAEGIVCTYLGGRQRAIALLEQAAQALRHAPVENQ
jgi:hypothetical protein